MFKHWPLGLELAGYGLRTPPQIGDQSWAILQFLFTTQHLQSTIGLNEVEMKLLVCTNTKPKQIHIMVLASWFYQAFHNQVCSQFTNFPAARFTSRKLK